MNNCWPRVNWNERRVNVKSVEPVDLVHKHSNKLTSRFDDKTKMRTNMNLDNLNMFTIPKGIHGAISPTSRRDLMHRENYTSAVKPAGMPFNNSKELHPAKETLQVKLETVEYVWEIEQFKRLRRLSKMNALPVDGTKAKSTVFGTPTAGYWYLEMCPGQANLDDTQQENAAIWLCLDTTRTAEAMAEFSFTILDADDNPIEGFQKGSINFQSFKADDEMDACHGVEVDARQIDDLIRDGALTIKCSLTVFLGIGGPISVDNKHVSVNELIENFNSNIPRRSGSRLNKRRLMADRSQAYNLNDIRRSMVHPYSSNVINEYELVPQPAISNLDSIGEVALKSNSFSPRGHGVVTPHNYHSKYASYPSNDGLGVTLSNVSSIKPYPMQTHRAMVATSSRSPHFSLHSPTISSTHGRQYGIHNSKDIMYTPHNGSMNYDPSHIRGERKPYVTRVYPDIENRMHPFVPSIV